VEFAGTDNALYERHRVFDNIIDLEAAGPRERFEAIARSARTPLSYWPTAWNTVCSQETRAGTLFTDVPALLAGHETEET
jgi:hypothetical protein